jgi:hypothetical protein
MNLYLYIPPLSAHPSSCFKGLIFGEIRRYWTQNNPSKFQEILLKFIRRLQDRGHSLQALTPLLTQAAVTLDSATWNPPSKESKDIYIHWKFYPEGIQCSDIQRVYKNTLQQHLEYDNARVAISRPKNLRDCLTKAKLTLPQLKHPLFVWATIHINKKRESTSPNPQTCPNTTGINYHKSR